MVAALTALAVSGCMLAPGGSVVDGWSTGDPVDCTRNDECDDFIPAATTGLDRRDPGHPAIIEVRLHLQGEPGQPILETCSGGCPVVAVFQLIDGSVRAIGVGTPGVERKPMTFDYGPGHIR
jgi:hypothetical protein